MFLHVSVILFTGGACMVGAVYGGGMHGRGVCMAGGVCGRGACMGGVCGRGHAWQGEHAWWGHVWQGACMAGGMHGGGCAWQGACMAGGMHGGGCAWQGACMARVAWQGMCMPCMPPSTMRYGRSMRGRYASYWNAFLFSLKSPQPSPNLLSVRHKVYFIYITNKGKFFVFEAVVRYI